MKYRVLVCDDDEKIVEAIEIYLLQEGYEVLKAYDGEKCLELLNKELIHLVVLDIMMPKLDGISTAYHIRQKYNVPIIMLSAKSESTDKIAGLSFGADDYVTKPFDMLELLARIKSNIRRYTMLGNMPQPEVCIRTGGVTVYTAYNKVIVDGEEVKFTPTEYKILRYLMEHMGTICSINQIYESVWKEEAYQADNTVSVHIRRIREKIEINPKEPKYLKVVWGNGYKIERLD